MGLKLWTGRLGLPGCIRSLQPIAYIIGFLSYSGFWEVKEHLYNILIVDDSAFMRNILRDIVESVGLNVVFEAENGNIGVEKFIELEPDLVIMDVTMPEMNGLEALQKIINYNNEAKIIICSAIGQKPMVTEAIKAGARDYIVKPFNRGRVVKAVWKTLIK